MKHWPMQETQEVGTRSLGWEGLLVEEMTTTPYCYMENSIVRGTWWAAVHGVTKSQTRLISPKILRTQCMHWRVA